METRGTETMIPPAGAAPRSPRQVRSRAISAVTGQGGWLILLAALAMTVLEGAFRKWVLPSGSLMKYSMYFSKDIIFAVLLFLPLRSRTTRVLGIFEQWLLPGTALLGLGAAISCSRGLNPVGALLTARAVVLLPLLVWLAVPRLAGLPLRWVLWLLLACTVLNFSLGIEQNRLPSGHILNRYAAEDAQIVEEHGGVRATGTFAYITGLGVLSTVGVWAGMAILSLAGNLRERAAAWVAIAAGFGCGLASLSRAPIAIGVAMVGSWLAGSKDGLSKLARGLAMGACCLVIALVLGLTSIFSKLGQALSERHAAATGSFNGRAFGQVDEMLDVLQAYPLGNGFGNEQVGGQYFAGGVASFNHFENPLPRLVLETGLLGLMGYLMVCAGAILALQKAKLTANSDVRAMLLATQVFLLPMFYGSVVFNHTGSAFTWMIVAAVLASAELAARRSVAAA